ncbi:hypothetical protein BATDEDRAFT_85529 [Batrachochytrium dendrobatidis JAM81]|uniref:Uncharacterized protein n=1 Tax=Batrachochytrium dendrobatidis (strain JAM81 / FGSC 10211) TaxID=684364 RepID=F4NTN9_BATDJ|nr:uncharacterized protein BATDEDRAFT_85529 [Batrachochytrium dendrobatidis JAM81]EGF83930.1 hypothetical protein BATDEDRAFT_85529 [Batrachochytrium dendrobatidis JAM81]KAJ8331329.1 putative malate dehydrogenase 1B [Batrachochytrium dendrobatidis]KAK5671778.1 putative malate dehydrogenase 1B [Batrachochytrium dendrobatidis]|eukprot:XP_006676278.1 hypothetical protein BATDEDRAFT_85529 [Batrachochytrium dendrobatidis JAM81]
MARFVLAGKASDSEFAQVEMMGYFLQENLPDFHVKVILHTDESWKLFVPEMFNQYAWNIRPARDRKIRNPYDLDQLIWVESGELIGNARDFIKLIHHNYGYENLLDSELLDKIVAENMTSLSASIPI